MWGGLGGILGKIKSFFIDGDRALGDICCAKETINDMDTLTE